MVVLIQLILTLGGCDDLESTDFGNFGRLSLKA